MIIGYARVSTDTQQLTGQRDTLATAGAAQVWAEQISGGVAPAERPQFRACLASLSPGDTLMVTSLDRLGRSVLQLVNLVDELATRGIDLVMLREQVDTRTAGGRFIYTVMSALAEMERELIRERTRAGLAAARRRGSKLGRPSVMSPERLRLARQLRDEGLSYRDVGHQLGVSAASISRHLARATARDAQHAEANTSRSTPVV